MAPLKTSIESARKELLELSTRNRLLSTPRHTARAKIVEVVDEKSTEIFRLLIEKKSKLDFLPAAEPSERDSDEGEHLLLQPSEDSSEKSPGRWVDRHLQTELDSARLQKRLLSMHYDARTMFEEQGVNTLFLALGFLKWFESQDSDRDRYAPLVLVPVELNRTSATARFLLSYSEEELSTNVSLREKLRAEFGIALPDLPESDDLDVAGYLRAVREALPSDTRWEVLEDDILLGFFSFGRFLMYRDLDPANWTDGSSLTDHPLVRSLLGDDAPETGDEIGTEGRVDDIIPMDRMTHVLDADSSQMATIEEVRRGRSMVVQGPPGTGKSQTIANMVATAVSEGKTVLFVSEKMAALEVVRRRLADVDLGDACLELHSHKSRPKSVLADLKSTLELATPVRVPDKKRKLGQVRDRLNSYVDALHAPMAPSGCTAYRVLGELVRLQRREVPDPTISLDAACNWNPEEREARREEVVAAARLADELSCVVNHPWSGTDAAPFTPMDRRRVQQDIQSLQEEIRNFRARARDLGSWFSLPEPISLLQVEELLKLADRAASAPLPHLRGLSASAWETQREELRRILDTGAELTDLVEQHSGRLTPNAWDVDVAPHIEALERFGRSIFRVFRKSYRNARRQARDVVRVMDGSRRDDLANLRTIQRVQACRSQLGAWDSLASSAFADLWNGERSDWSLLDRVEKWEADAAADGLPHEWRAALSHDFTSLSFLPMIAGLRRGMDGVLERGRQIYGRLGFDLLGRLEVKTSSGIDLDVLGQQLQAFLDNLESLNAFIRYRDAARDLQEAGLEEVANLFGRQTSSEVIDQFDFAVQESLWRRAVHEHPSLGGFDRSGHEADIAVFRQLDVDRIRGTSSAVAKIHHAQIPRFNGPGGEMGIVLRETAKKRRHLPLRRLLEQAGSAIAKIKPVFMMSPMSVAQFLSPGRLTFDLLLIDEASQVRPAEALGVVARSRQIVVVGDERQLPPTRFFDKTLGDVDDTDDDTERLGDLESILTLCESKGFPRNRLRWHYRSRHESLIAVSNQEFYDSALYIVPSSGGDADLGLHFRYIKDGVFDRGRSKCNRREARAVAEAVMRHAKECSDQSLGVGAFSVSQRDAILDELELLRRESQESEDFFAEAKAEPFFVKNLENIQGDEKDVIFISIGYGPDADGRVHMNFGPLSANGGERRLNVLISRARFRCEVFSALRADDIDLSRARGVGPKALKTFLKYAETGNLDVAVPVGAGFDSPFEEEVFSALERRGYSVDMQVGVGQFRVDLAVKDPDQPGRYVLGIECDGASYHSARAVRDRDRLRQQILEDRGWSIHRIWSTDWFEDPAGALQRAVDAIEHALGHDSGSNGSGSDRAASLRVQVQRERGPETGLPPDVMPYEEAQFQVPKRIPIHDLDTDELAKVVTEIIDVESPIHEEELARRVTRLWGLQRAGRRIQDAVNEALVVAKEQRLIQRQGKFWIFPHRKVVVRSREDVDSPPLRKPEMLPPSEVSEALHVAIRHGIGLDRDEACASALRLLGFGRAGHDLVAVTKKALKELVKRGRIRTSDGQFYASEG